MATAKHERDVRLEARSLPAINPAVVAAMEDMLQSDSGSLKPPTQAARLMALLYELHELKRPIPRREVMAEAIGGSKSKYTVDAILYSKRAEGYLDLVMETTIGNTQGRAGIRQERFIIPSKRVQDVAKSAAKKRA